MTESHSKNPLPVENETDDVVASSRGSGNASRKKARNKCASRSPTICETGVVIGGRATSQRFIRYPKTVPEIFFPSTSHASSSMFNVVHSSGRSNSSHSESHLGTNKLPENNEAPSSSHNGECSNQLHHPPFLSPFLTKLKSSVPSLLIGAYSQKTDKNLTVENEIDDAVAPENGGDKLSRREAWNKPVNSTYEVLERLLNENEYRKFMDLCELRWVGSSDDESTRLLRLIESKHEGSKKRNEPAKMHRQVREKDRTCEGLERHLKDAGSKDVSENENRKLMNYIEALNERAGGGKLLAKRKFGISMDLEGDAVDEKWKKIKKLSIPQAKTLLHELEWKIEYLLDPDIDHGTDGTLLALGR